MLKKPLISIITIVLNNVKYIEKTILNYLSQNCELSELVIIDGGSIDGTIEIIEKYGREFNNIRWISEKDSGQSDAMNKGIRLANGTYISFLNSDDYYNENTLNTALKILLSNNKIDFLVGNCNVWDQNNNLVYINKPIHPTTKNLLLSRYIPVNPSAYFYRKSLHDLTGGYNISNHYNMDIEFLLLASRYTKFFYVPITFGNFRLLPDAKTGSDSIAGLLEKRKKELFNFYINQFGFSIKFGVLLLKLGIKTRTIYKDSSSIIFDKLKYEFRKLTQRN